MQNACRDSESLPSIPKANQINGKYEIQVSEGGRADPHTYLVECNKNPGHTQFVPISEFNINHLPELYHDNDIVEFIKATAHLTVRVCLQKTSKERPKFLPYTKDPYPFYNGGIDVMRFGTGQITSVEKLDEKKTLETCECKKCQQHPNTPSKVWGRVIISTAKVLVFDDHEAEDTTCRVFYDKPDSPMLTLDGWDVVDGNMDEDMCKLRCVTCDVDLLDKLDKMSIKWHELWNELNAKYKNLRDDIKMIIIVSHPHGYYKQVSVGHWINRYLVSDDWTKYTYTTCTCPGSTGAYVLSLGYYDGWLFDANHLHKGVNSEGTNVSSTGRDLGKELPVLTL